MSDLEDLIERLTRLDSLQLFFVGGQGKSGTTWVEHLLDAHPEVSCRGEGHLADVLLPSLRTALDEHRRFLSANDARFPELLPYPVPEAEDRRRILKAVLALELGQLDTGGQLKALADRTPANADCLGEIASLFPEAHFIHVVRDPRDAAISMWHHLGRLDPSRSGQRYKDIESFVVALVGRWRDAFLGVRDTGRRALGERYHEIRYEDLHQRPTETLAPVLGAIGVATDAATLRACVDAAAFRRLSGGRDAGEEDRGSQFRKGVVGDWRTHVSDPCNRRALAAGGELMRELGYF